MCNLINIHTRYIHYQQIQQMLHSTLIHQYKCNVFLFTAAYDPTAYLNVLTFFPLTRGCSEGLDVFRFFF